MYQRYAVAAEAYFSNTSNARRSTGNREYCKDAGGSGGNGMECASSQSYPRSRQSSTSLLKISAPGVESHHRHNQAILHLQLADLKRLTCSPRRKIQQLTATSDNYVFWSDAAWLAPIAAMPLNRDGRCWVEKRMIPCWEQR
jgi:hypothetical protein